MKPLTQDELWLLDQKVAEGETVKLWVVWPYELSGSSVLALRAEPGKLLYVDDDPVALVDFTLEKLPSNSHSFTNYWHAYAYNLKQLSGGK